MTIGLDLTYIENNSIGRISTVFYPRRHSIDSLSYYHWLYFVKDVRATPEHW